MSKHSESHGPNSPCHPGCKGWEEPIAHEETRARQTGTTITQLQTEQRIAELQASISKQIAELYELVSPTDQECNDHAEECHDDRRGSAESLAEDRMAQIEYALWVRDPENADAC